MNTLQTLVVDDSASARVVLKKLLEKSGIQVYLSKSGLEALSFLRSHSPDLIFMDHTMPGMDGLEVTKAITTNPKTASIPVVMYTSNDEEGYFENAREHGAIDIVSKPASPEKLLAVLTNLVTLHGKQQEALKTQLNEHLKRFYGDIEALVEQRLLETELSVKKHIASQLDKILPKESRHQRPNLPLIHSITDTKIHQLNIELRNHMSAKLDVLRQDFQADCTQHHNAINQRGDSLEQKANANVPTFAQSVRLALSPKAILTAASNLLGSSNFYLGVLISACTLLTTL